MSDNEHFNLRQFKQYAENQLVVFLFFDGILVAHSLPNESRIKWTSNYNPKRKQLKE